MSTKTNKSFAKRVKVRRKAGDEVRTPGHGHFNAKESGRAKMKKNRSNKANFTPKVRQQNMPHNA